MKLRLGEFRREGNRVWSKMIPEVREPVMNTPSSTDSATSDRPNPLGITGDSKPTVPVFSCIVYVCKTADGTIRGRVANLAGDDSGEISATGNSERDVLLNVTREFKARVLTMHGENQEIAWIDPPQPPLENEQVRFVPVHL
jgi:hypothetical protein